jgi:hypothetical protein
MTPDEITKCSSNEKFSEYLHQEILHHKEKRSSFVLQKLAFIVALFGVVSMNNPFSSPDQIDWQWIIYMIPFVALAYDIYIFSEDFKVKRLGKFIRHSIYSSECEKEWEKYVYNWREPYAIIGSLVLTSITIIGPPLIFKVLIDKTPVFLLIWLISLVFLSSLIFMLYYCFIACLDDYQFPKQQDNIPQEPKELAKKRNIIIENMKKTFFKKYIPPKS